MGIAPPALPPLYNFIVMLFSMKLMDWYEHFNQWQGQQLPVVDTGEEMMHTTSATSMFCPEK